MRTTLHRANTWLMCGILSLGMSAMSVARAADNLQPTEELQKELNESKMAESLEGKAIRLQGKKVVDATPKKALFYVLYYSAAFCGPCREACPDNIAIYKERVANNPLIEVIFCGYDDDPSETLTWAKQAKMPWVMLMNNQLNKVPAVKALKPEMIPYLVLVDPDGEKLMEGSLEELLDKADEVIAAVQKESPDAFVKAGSESSTKGDPEDAEEEE